MHDQTKKLLLDVVEAGRSIRKRCSGSSFADYEADRWFRRAVEREFEIIAEALARLNRVDPLTASMIPDLPRIIAFRNRIIHAYDAIDDAAVWGVVEAHLPKLLADVEGLVSQHGDLI